MGSPTSRWATRATSAASPTSTPKMPASPEFMGANAGLTGVNGVGTSTPPQSVAPPPAPTYAEVASTPPPTGSPGDLNKLLAQIAAVTQTLAAIPQDCEGFLLAQRECMQESEALSIRLRESEQQVSAAHATAATDYQALKLHT